MLSPHFYDVFRHMEWADALIWSAILESEKAATDSYIQATFFHQHSTQHSFLNAWLGRPFERWDQAGFPTARDIASWGRDFHIQMPDFLVGLEDEELEAPFVLPWTRFYARALGRDPAETTLRETMHQLPSHSMHHRGQIMRQMRELGMKPPTADYIVWVWQDRPEADWPI